jgi:SAM-dependent methyltransferase
MLAHLKAMQKKWYGVVENFNHGYPQRTFRDGCRTLEIGAGLGAHLKYEHYMEQEYHANELRPELCEQLSTAFPEVNVRVGDCQQRLPYEDAYFDRILAIHVLEHLPDLPNALLELYRVLNPNGALTVVIPCEGGWVYTLARNISARPHFEKKYGLPYDWFVASEHLNRPEEIMEEIAPLFSVEHRRFYPFLIPIVCLNLCIGLTLRKKV